MKRNELIKQIRENGAVFARHGNEHDVYRKGKTELFVPRHDEIAKGTAKSLIKKSKS